MEFTLNLNSCNILRCVLHLEFSLILSVIQSKGTNNLWILPRRYSPTLDINFFSQHKSYILIEEYYTSCSGFLWVQNLPWNTNGTKDASAVVPHHIRQNTQCKIIAKMAQWAFSTLYHVYTMNISSWDCNQNVFKRLWNNTCFIEITGQVWLWCYS